VHFTFPVIQDHFCKIISASLRCDGPKYIRPKGREEAIDVRYELLPKGLYASQVEPLRDVVYGIDQKIR